ncbi:hypothetical protein NQZ68_027597 [Dissostichus eleginoides]|nr:hypothetical protein NQZ68_027597 [Dissostichus eleginoides]
MISIGRNCKWPVWQLGFSQRLQMAPSDTGSKFCQRPDKNTSSRVGGSVFTCLSRFQNMWLRRQQCSGYDVCGNVPP